MRRFNLFQTSHSALRAQLLDASLQLQFTNFTKPQQVQHRFDQVIELVLACQRQAEEESRYIIPALQVFEKKVPECFAANQQVRFPHWTESWIICWFLIKKQDPIVPINGQVFFSGPVSGNCQIG